MTWLRRFAFSLPVLASLALGCSADDGDVAGAAGGTGGSDQPQSGVDYLIVTANPLVAAAQRYRDFRQADGYRVALELLGSIAGQHTDPETVTWLIRQRVKQYYDQRDTSKPMFLLIIGDAQTGSLDDWSTVPAGSFYDTADQREVTSDNVFGDMDDDHLPDIAVGRIPAATEQDVDLVREKVVAYESSYEPGLWNRRVNVFASTAGFGEPYDSQIEQVAFDIAESASYDFDLTMTYASQNSPYVYVPEAFSDKVYDRINEGSLLVSYIGHGLPTGFASLTWNGQYYEILNVSELDKIDVVHKQPILSLIACSMGAFDLLGESVSEKILKLPTGPNTVLSSTEISHPAINGMFIYEYSQVITELHTPTSGQAFMVAKQRLLNNDDPLREAIDELAAMFADPSEVAALKLSHLHMYALFGDPALRIAYPRFSSGVQLSPSSGGPTTAIAVTTSLGDLGPGQATITFETKRSDIAGSLQAVPADGEPDRDAIIMANYQTANDKVVHSQSVNHQGGTLSATLQVPGNLSPGDYYVKVHADDGQKDLTGAAQFSLAP